MSNIRNLLEKMDQFAGQAVGQKPGDQVRGTDKAKKTKDSEHPFKGRLVGESNLLKELEQELAKPQAVAKRNLAEEFEAFKEDGEVVNAQDIIKLDVPLFIRLLEYAREDAKTDMDLHDVAEKLITMCSTGDVVNMDRYNDIVSGGSSKIDEYGAVGGYGAASQAPQGTVAGGTDPKSVQQQKDLQQTAKSLQGLKGALPPGLDPAKAVDVIAKADAPAQGGTAGPQLNAQDLEKLEPITKALPDVLKNPQTAGQLKQIISKAQAADKQTQAKVQQQQQQTGTNAPTATTTPTTPGQPK